MRYIPIFSVVLALTLNPAGAAAETAATTKSTPKPAATTGVGSWEDLDVDAQVRYKLERFERPRWNFSLTPGVVHFNYSEPTVMSDVGGLYGANANVSFEAVPSVILTAGGSYHQGATTYRGGLFALGSSEVIPYSTKARNALTRFDLGAAFDFPIGVGVALRPGLNLHHYRLWNPKTDRFSYNRHIVQSYLNPQVAVVIDASSTQRLTIGAGYLLMVGGTVKTGPTNQFGPLEFDQNGGMGLRTSVGYESELSESTRFAGNLGFEWRSIAESDVAFVPGGALVEPRNRTTLITIAAGLAF